MINVIDGVSEAVTLANATEQVITDKVIVYADGLEGFEHVDVYRLGPSGGYVEATNAKGRIILSKYPNMVELPAGTYKFVKGKTAAEVYLGY
jgi:hypothetical protein